MSKLLLLKCGALSYRKIIYILLIEHDHINKYLYHIDIDKRLVKFSVIVLNHRREGPDED